jgi:hypothetical protein
MADDMHHEEDNSLVAAGGWSIPNQTPGWPFDRLLIPIRGGMKYPQPTKGTPMAKTLNQELATLKADRDNLSHKIDVLERKVKARRTPPPSDQNMWTIDARFTPEGKLYNYLILRANGAFYTTGNGADATFFSWASLLRWLDGMAQHSAMIPLACDHNVPAPLEGRQ